MRLEKTKRKLEKKKEKIERKIKTLKLPPEFSSDIGSSEEEADETEKYGNQLALAQRLKTILEKINHSLTKIDKDSYGICEKCGGRISKLVLSIEPTSRFCRKCKKSLNKSLDK